MWPISTGWFATQLFARPIQLGGNAVNQAPFEKSYTYTACQFIFELFMVQCNEFIFELLMVQCNAIVEMIIYLNPNILNKKNRVYRYVELRNVKNLEHATSSDTF